MASSILNLPPEIREQIYRECVRIPKIHDDNGFAHYEPDLAILKVNRLIHQEAEKIFQEENIFLKITTPWREATDYIFSQGRVPILVSGDRAIAFEKVHLRISIESPDLPFAGSGHSMITLLADLPAFTQLWHFSDLHHRGFNMYFKLCLHLQDPYIPDRKIPKALQQRLLMPFGEIKGLKESELTGMVLPSVRQALEKEAKIPNLTPEECLDKASDLKDAGNEFVKAKRYKEALKSYFDAFKAMHILVNGRQRTILADGYFTQDLQSGKFANQQASCVRILLRVKLVANIVLTYLNLKEWEEAHFWGKRTIILFQSSIADEQYARYPSETDWIGAPILPNFGTAPEMGKIYYRTAQAARALRKTNEVEKLLRAAAVYLPGDEQIEKRLSEIEAQSRGKKVYEELENLASESKTERT